MYKCKVVLAMITGLCILVICLNFHKKNQNPIFEMYVAVDTNNTYYDLPSCYNKSWYATLEKLDNQQYHLKITKGYIRTTDDVVNYKYGLKFLPLEETEVSVLSKKEYEKFEDEFDYIQKNYEQRSKDEMYDGFYEGTTWYIFIKGKYYSSVSEKRGNIDYNDLMQDQRVNNDFFGLFNSYMNNPPLEKPWN